MKPWMSQSVAKSAAPIEKKPEGPGPLAVNEHVNGIGFLMRQSPTFWREMGKKKPMVAQFRVPNDAAASWFVQVDADGGKASVGLHSAPTVTWESDREAMDAAFQGKILPGRIRVMGDFEEMRALFAAIAQTSIPGH